MKVYYSKGIYYNMGILEIFFTGIGLSMDALAVSVCKGLSIKKLRFNTAFMIAFFFGIFQAAMPLIGWLLGIRFKQYIETAESQFTVLMLNTRMQMQKTEMANMV